MASWDFLLEGTGDLPVTKIYPCYALSFLTAHYPVGPYVNPGLLQIRVYPCAMTPIPIHLFSPKHRPEKELASPFWGTNHIRRESETITNKMWSLFPGLLLSYSETLHLKKSFFSLISCTKFQILHIHTNALM